MATLLSLKYEYGETTGKPLKPIACAKDIALASVNVILTLPRPYPDGWEQQRM